MIAFILLVGILILIFCPRRYDPAIRLKDWNEQYRYNPKHDGFPEQLGGD